MTTPDAGRREDGSVSHFPALQQRGGTSRSDVYPGEDHFPEAPSRPTTGVPRFDDGGDEEEDRLYLEDKQRRSGAERGGSSTEDDGNDDEGTQSASYDDSDGGANYEDEGALEDGDDGAGYFTPDVLFPRGAAPPRHLMSYAYARGRDGVFLGYLPTHAAGMFAPDVDFSEWAADDASLTRLLKRAGGSGMRLPLDNENNEEEAQRKDAQSHRRVLLRSLNLSGCHACSDIGILPLLARAPFLVELDLSGIGAHLSDALLVALAGGGDGDGRRTAGAPNLQALDVSRCTGLTDRGFQALFGWLHATRLEDGEAGVTTRVAGTPCHGLPKLERLACAGCRGLSDVSLVRLAAAPVAATLRRLDVSDCPRVTDEGMRAVLGVCKSLLSLTVRNNASGVCGAMFRVKAESHDDCQLYVCSNLKHLDVSGCVRFTDATVGWMTKACADLESVDVSHCPRVTGVGLTGLVYGCRRIVSLSAIGCRNLGNSLGAAIKTCLPNIASLDLAGPITDGVSDDGELSAAGAVGRRGGPSPWGSPKSPAGGDGAADGRNALTSESLMDVISKCREIVHLNLSGSPCVDDACFTGEAEIDKNMELLRDDPRYADTGRTPLRSVHLRDCPRLTDVGFAACAWLFRHTLTLDVSGCTKEFGNTALYHVTEHCSALTDLNLNRCDRVTDVGVKRITSRCRKLETLRLSATHPVVEAARAAAHAMTREGMLAAIKAERGELDSDDEESAKNAPGAHIVGSQAVGDKTLGAIFRRLRSLRVLEFRNRVLARGNTVPTAGQSSFLCTDLRTLDVAGCTRLSRDTLKDICVSCPLLNELNVAGCDAVLPTLNAAAAAAADGAAVEPFDARTLQKHMATRSRVLEKLLRLAPLGRELLEYVDGAAEAVEAVAAEGVASALEEDPSAPRFVGLKPNNPHLGLVLRQRLCRARIAREHEAATELQRRWRSWLAGDFTLKYLVLWTTKLRQKARTIDNAIIMQKNWRRKLGMRRAWARREVVSAERIQRLVRWYQAYCRNIAAHMRVAACKRVQAWWRRCQYMKISLRDRIWACVQERKRLEEIEQRRHEHRWFAARCMQNWYRRVVAVRDLRHKQQARKEAIFGSALIVPRKLWRRSRVHAPPHARVIDRTVLRFDGVDALIEATVDAGNRDLGWNTRPGTAATSRSRRSRPGTAATYRSRTSRSRPGTAATHRSRRSRPRTANTTGGASSTGFSRPGEMAWDGDGRNGHGGDGHGSGGGEMGGDVPSDEEEGYDPLLDPEVMLQPHFSPRLDGTVRDQDIDKVRRFPGRYCGRCGERHAVVRCAVCLWELCPRCNVELHVVDRYGNPAKYAHHPPRKAIEDRLPMDTRLEASEAVATHAVGEVAWELRRVRKVRNQRLAMHEELLVAIGRLQEQRKARAEQEAKERQALLELRISKFAARWRGILVRGATTPRGGPGSTSLVGPGRAVVGVGLAGRRTAATEAKKQAEESRLAAAATKIQSLSRGYVLRLWHLKLRMDDTYLFWRAVNRRKIRHLPSGCTRVWKRAEELLRVEFPKTLTGKGTGFESRFGSTVRRYELAIKRKAKEVKGLALESSGYLKRWHALLDVSKRTGEALTETAQQQARELESEGRRLECLSRGKGSIMILMKNRLAFLHDRRAYEVRRDAVLRAQRKAFDMARESLEAARDECRRTVMAVEEAQAAEEPDFDALNARAEALFERVAEMERLEEEMKAARAEQKQKEAGAGENKDAEGGEETQEMTEEEKLAAEAARILEEERKRKEAERKAKEKERRMQARVKTWRAQWSKRGAWLRKEHAVVLRKMLLAEETVMRLAEALRDARADELRVHRLFDRVQQEMTASIQAEIHYEAEITHLDAQARRLTIAAGEGAVGLLENARKRVALRAKQHALHDAYGAAVLDCVAQADAMTEERERFIVAEWSDAKGTWAVTARPRRFEFAFPRDKWEVDEGEWRALCAQKPWVDFMQSGKEASERLKKGNAQFSGAMDEARKEQEEKERVESEAAALAAAEKAALDAIVAKQEAERKKVKETYGNVLSNLLTEVSLELSAAEEKKRRLQMSFAERFKEDAYKLIFGRQIRRKQEMQRVQESIENRQKGSVGYVEAISELRITTGKTTKAFGEEQEVLKRESQPHFRKVEKNLGRDWSVHLWYLKTIDQALMVTDLVVGSSVKYNKQAYLEPTSLLAEGYRRTNSDVPTEGPDSTQLVIWTRSDSQKPKVLHDVAVTFTEKEEKYYAEDGYTRMDPDLGEIRLPPDARVWCKFGGRQMGAMQKAKDEQYYLDKIQGFELVLKEEPKNRKVKKEIERLREDLRQWHLNEQNKKKNKLRNMVEFLALSERDMRKLGTHFSDIDADDSGEIDLTEFFDYLDIDRTAFTDALFAFLDESNDGTIDFAEFVHACGTICMWEKKQILQFMFGMYDTAGNGYIVENQLEALLAAVAGDDPINIQGTDRVMARFDKDGDGKVTWAEFQQAAARFPSAFLPAFRLLTQWRAKILGAAFWTRKKRLFMQVREKMGKDRIKAAEAGKKAARDRERKRQQEERERRLAEKAAQLAELGSPMGSGGRPSPSASPK